MKFSRKLFVVTALLILLTLTAKPNLAAPVELTSLLSTAHGQGTVTVGKEVFHLSTVVVKLNEDGTGEITLITDLQLMVHCRWSAPDDLSKGIDLKITGGASVGGAQGSGKLFLRPDAKAIASLSMEGSSNTAKRKIVVKFVAD